METGLEVHQLGQSKGQDAHTELVKFLAVCSRHSIAGSPSRIVDEAWHAWLSDPVAYEMACTELFGLVPAHRPCQPSSARYLAAREAMVREFGTVDPVFWPRVDNEEVARHIVADCFLAE